MKQQESNMKIEDELIKISEQMDNRQSLSYFLDECTIIYDNIDDTIDLRSQMLDVIMKISAIDVSARHVITDIYNVLAHNYGYIKDKYKADGLEYTSKELLDICPNSTITKLYNIILQHSKFISK